MKRKLAIFDIDGTIFRSSLVAELTHFLINEKIFPQSVLSDINKNHAAWLNRNGEYDTYILSIVDVYIKHIAGKKVNVINKMVKKVISNQKDRQYLFTRNLIKELKNKNYFLLAISGSPVHIVAEFAKELSFDEYFGSVFEVKNGAFTGIPLSNMQKEKRATIKKFIGDNKENITLSGSIGVGDTISDIPILEVVENPIAFNPNRELTKTAQKNKWRIVVERKDVIYDINKFEILTASEV